MSSSNTAFAPRARASFVAFAALLALSLLAGCGGGTDVAPAEPEIMGDGFGTGLLAGEAIGTTELVEASVVPGASTNLTVTETVTFTTDIVPLANDMLTAMGVEVTDGMTAFVEFTDFEVERSTGTLERISGGAIPAGATVDVTYEFEKQFQNMLVGILFIDGTFGEVTIYNLDEDQTGPLTLTETRSGTPPADMQAFAVVLEVGLEGPAGTGDDLSAVGACDTSTDPVACPLMNVLALSSYDISNPLNPCVTGSLQATVEATGGDPVPLELEFMDPVC